MEELVHADPPRPRGGQPTQGDLGGQCGHTSGGRPEASVEDTDAAVPPGPFGPSAGACEQHRRDSPGSCSWWWWAEGWRVGGTEAEPKHMVAVYLLGSGAGLMGQPQGHGEAALRGALDQGGPSPPFQLRRSAGQARSLGLCGAGWGPGLPLPTHQPAGELWPQPRLADTWKCQPPHSPPQRVWACPSLSSEPPGVPARCSHHGREGGHLARHDLWPSPGRLRRPLPSGPHSPPHGLNQSSPHPPNSWCFQGNYLMNQQCGGCGGGMAAERAFLPALGPPGTEGTCGAAEPPARLLLPQAHTPSTLRVKETCSPKTWVTASPCLLWHLPAVWPYKSHFSSPGWRFSYLNKWVNMAPVLRDCAA